MVAHALHDEVCNLAPRNNAPRLEIARQHGLNLGVIAQLTVDASAVPVHKTYGILCALGLIAARFLAFGIVTLDNKKFGSVVGGCELVVERRGTDMEIWIVGHIPGGASVTLHKVGFAVLLAHTLFALLPTAEYHRRTPFSVLLGGHGWQYAHVRPLRVAVAFLQRLCVKEVKQFTLGDKAILIAVPCGRGVSAVLIGQSDVRSGFYRFVKFGILGFFLCQFFLHGFLILGKTLFGFCQFLLVWELTAVALFKLGSFLGVMSELLLTPAKEFTALSASHNVLGDFLHYVL